MQRLVEQPVDEGVMYEGPMRIGRVHYHLSVYQHFAGGEGESVVAHTEVEGRIAPVDPVDVAALPAHTTEYTLYLADGRRLDFTMASSEGRIRSTGRGLYQPE